MKVRIFLVFSILFFTEGLLAQTPFENKLGEFLEKPEYKNALVGIHVAGLETGESIFELNSQKLYVPASVMKLVTSAAALEILGAGYRFQTRVGYTGKIRNGTLEGDLIVMGGGDPALGSEYFPDHYFHPHFLETWAKLVKAAGIRRVKGNLVLDSSWFNSEKVPPTWIWEDIGNYYGAGTSALAVYDNLFRVSFRSPAVAGLPTEITSVFPKVEGIEWENEVLSSEDNRDLAYVFGSPLDGKRAIRGTIPKNRRRFTIKASNPFPEKLLADDFLRYLARTGVFISGNIAEKKVSSADFHPIDVLESPPLSQIVKVLNQESVNLFAEQLVKQIDAENAGTGDREAGLEHIAEFWETKGLNIRQLFMEDGSGLSHFNAVSPAFLTSLLRFMENSKNRDAFIESLPLPGEGTLDQLSPEQFPGQTLRAKSGSMTRVRCYAGYLETSKGERIVFSVMVNHFAGSHWKLINELENILSGLREN